MNKNDFVSHVAADASATRNIAECTVATDFSAVDDALTQDEPASIAGFGKFETRSRVAWRGLNPETGQPVSIAVSGVPSFKAAVHNQLSAFPTCLETQSADPGNSYAWVIR